MSLILSGTDGLSDVDGTVSTPAIRGTDANTGIFFPAADTIAFTEGGAESMRIDSSGNVGIGSTSPLSKLEVVGGQFRVANTSSAAVCIISTDSTSTNGVTVESSYYGGAGYGPMKFNTGGSERMRIDSSGNVGIGNTPSGNSATGYRSLELGTTAGTGIVAGNGDLYIPVNSYIAGGAWKYAATGQTASLFNAAGNVYTWSQAASGTAGNNISFSERMRITSGGNLCLGTTTKNNDGLLSISADAAANQGIAIKETSISNSVYYIYFTNSDGNGAGRIEHTGATTVSYVTSSDARLKTNIVDADSAKPIIDAIKIREFDWVSGEHQKFGAVAQELIEVAPEAVSVGRTDNDSWGVDYSKLVPHLIKYVQELKAELDSVKAELQTLKGN